MTKSCARLVLLPLITSLAACVGTSKSANPLSPAVAGPIPGVGISAPVVVAPGVDALIDTGTQPITLQVQNATTTGVRPLTYVFEIAMDPNFTNKVFIRDAVPQDSSGRTSLRLPDPLAPERKYYWHSRAEDGANTGPFGATSAFSVFTPVNFGAPVLIQPINNVTTSTKQPRLVVGNAARTGPVGAVAYSIEVADSAGFTNIVGSWAVPETANQTALDVPVALATGQYFWRALCYDPGHTGPYSDVQSFRTPASGGGGGGGDCNQDTSAPIFNPNGNWQACGSTPGADIVDCVYAAITPSNTVNSIFEMTKRVAWLLRASGFGLLKKCGGDNVAGSNGVGYAAARISLADGHIFKLLNDVPNGKPQWSDEGVQPAQAPNWVAALQP